MRARNHHADDTTDLLETALTYFDLGWAVIPVPFRQKAPLMRSWQKLRMGRDDVPSHFNGKPSNLGVLLGDPSAGLVDVDLDCLESVVLAEIFLPPTGVIFGRSGKPRSHHLYRADPLISTAKFEDVDGSMLVELRSTGCQTVVPPSIHPSGEPISWACFGEPLQIPGAILHKHVARLAAASLLARHWPGQGSRHQAALALAATLARGGWAEQELIDFTRAVVQGAGDTETPDRIRAARDSFEKVMIGQPVTGWPTLARLIDEHVLSRVQQWLGLRNHSQRQLPSDESPVPFPLESLPPAFRALVEEGSASIVVPADFLAVPLLVAAGGAMGDAVELQIKPGWSEGANIYAAIVGDPGAKKTPALNLALRPLIRVQARLKQDYDAELERHQAEMVEWGGPKKGNRGPRPQPPTFRHVITTDATIEAVAPMLQVSKGVLVMKDELAGWVRAMDQYHAGGKGAERQHYLSLWSRSMIKVDRKGMPAPIVVLRPHLSVVGGIQPDLLPELADTAQRQDGFLDRLLWSYPAKVPDHWTKASVSDDTIQNVEALFQRLDALTASTDDVGRRTRQTMVLGADAEVVWSDWYGEHVAETNEERIPKCLVGPWAKMPSQFARLILILHVLRDGNEREVQAVTVGAAADLIDYFKSHARRVYRLLIHQRADLKIRLLQALKAQGPMNQRDILHHVFQRNVSASAVTQALEELEEAGLVQREARQGEVGRPATIWSVA